MQSQIDKQVEELRRQEEQNKKNDPSYDPGKANGATGLHDVAVSVLPHNHVALRLALSPDLSHTEVSLRCGYRRELRRDDRRG